MRKIAAFPAFVLGALALAGSVAPACAQVYKWVDDRGVTHYSDEAPAKGGSAKTAVVVRERLSVYSTPSPPATPASQYTGDPILRNRVEALERQILAERLARDSLAAAEARTSLAVYERCLADRRVDCDEYGGLYPPYAWPVVVSRPPHHHRRPFPAPHPSPLTGMTAGTVVGPGIIPGNFNGPGAVTAGNLVTFRTNLTTQGSRSGRSMFR